VLGQDERRSSCCSRRGTSRCAPLLLAHPPHFVTGRELIPDLETAAKQARHGAFLSNALKDLAADVNELDSLVADNPPADAPRTRPHFAPFLVTRTSPTWPQVKVALVSTFSSIAQPNLQAVEPGPSGMAAVLFVLEGMVDWEADRNSVRQAIYSLSTAVTTATESIRCVPLSLSGQRCSR